MTYSSFIQAFETATSSILNDPLRFSVSLLVAIFIIILLLYSLIRSLRSEEKLKYEFITIIAHKFRTPLAQVKWSLNELIPPEQDPYTKEMMEGIRQSNERLIQLTATLIELADSNGKAKASYHFERINLCEIVRSRGEALRDFFHEKNLFFSVRCAEDDIPVQADRSRLEFVLQTIMENAVTYSPPGRNVEIIVYREGRKAHVSVTDHGIGMDRLDLMRVFSKFFRAKNARAVDTEGFGVGLYLAQSVMRSHHGKIEAFSEGINKGSTFVVSMPLSKEK